MSFDHKGLLILLDGVGDRPCEALGGRTPLEAAYTPNLDRLVSEGLCGQVDSLLPGVPAGTQTGTGVLLGLPPADILHLERGPVEAAGIGLPMEPGDVALRCNFATLEPRDEDLVVLDRRAGRIREGTDALADALTDVDLGWGIRGTLRPATQHRAVLKLTGPGLSAAVSDTDPGAGREGGLVATCMPQKADDADAKRTAQVVNRFVRSAFERMSGHPVNRKREADGLLPANGVITRGAGRARGFASLLDPFGISAAVITGEMTVLGIGTLFNYTRLNEPSFTALPDTNLDGKVSAATAALEDHDLVFLHIKGADICAHDRDAVGKKEFLERVDQALVPILRGDLVVGVSGDHSTDVRTGRHCGDPVPSLLRMPHGRRDLCQRFGETECMTGGLGRITGTAFLTSLLDAMGVIPNFRPSQHWRQLGFP
jgi:2,3-bisphosphoglycerate-independent phosphoglycerate mutase